MPALTETARKVKLKRMVDPGDPDPSNPENYIDIPVIVQATLNDPGGVHNYQNYVRKFDNTSANQSRETHTQEVDNQLFDSSGGEITTDDTNNVSVERIDQCNILNSDQKELLNPTDSDPPPLGPINGPNYDPAIGHWVTHVVRYNQSNTNDPDATPWVDIELVDQMKIGTGFFKQRNYDRAQVTTLILQNDPGNGGSGINGGPGSYAGGGTIDTSPGSGPSSAADGSEFSDPADPFDPAWSDITYWGVTPDPSGATDDYLPMDSNGNPAAVRIDPFQNIVNIDWGGLAVEFHDGAE